MSNNTNKTQSIDLKEMLKQTGIGAAVCGSKMMELAVFAVFATATLHVVYRTAESPVTATIMSAGGLA